MRRALWEIAAIVRYFDVGVFILDIWGGMDPEQTIAEIEWLERIFGVPDTRPLGPKDLSAARAGHEASLR
jgi:hypothetical protein